MPVLIISALVAISAFLAIRAEYFGPRSKVYLFKPLTVLLIILIALQTKNQTSHVYRIAIIAGLLFSLMGDIFLMLPRDRFIQGLVSFLVAHLCYIAAFITEGNRAFSTLSLLPFFVYGGLMLHALWPHLGKMRAPVVIYMLVILLMGWQAASRFLVENQEGSLLAFIGSLFFIASDSILAINRFKTHFKSAQALTLTTYFIAQWLIALST
ncbi:MAG: hypothetical protein AUG51_16800 [Acidobacteria bacterium 13_1_20CM_3_53_8]|nr:MAG: hypothetical protein AUG51_16800 [Acidobacteria bacterium 13_1_20CM_3_53_8]